MSFTIQFALRVFEDLQQGYNYYIEKQAIQAAESFLDNIQNTLDTIKRNPYTFNIRYGIVRCGIPKNFPFLVHYCINEKENSILVIAVASTHQKPLW